MKAAVCYEFGRPLIIEELEIDPPGAGEVRVRVEAASICHSDIHLVHGDWEEKVPTVPGHEVAGVVEEVGDGVKAVKPGDPVVLCLMRWCGECFYCRKGATQMCEGKFALQTESRLRNGKGDPIDAGINIGGFAEYAVVHESQVVKIPADLSFDRAALLACGVITGVGSVLNTAKVEAGSSVVVVGAGGVGLNAIQGAVLAGAAPIIAVDMLESKLAMARTFGATETVNASACDPVQAVKGLTSGRGADYVFVTVGSIGAMNQGMQLAGRHGTEVIVGIPAAGTAVSIDAIPLTRHEKRVIGSRMGSTDIRRDIPQLIEYYRGGRLKLDELITRRYRLEEINEAIEATEKGEALRNVIIFE